MVAKVDDLPRAFVAYKTLTVCSNIMHSGTAPFVIGSVVPLLIGKSEHPRIWLAAPADAKGDGWVELVDGGESRHPELTVLVTENYSQTSIQFRKTPLLEVKTESSGSATVPLIDLRPIGLNVYGDQNELYIGNNTFSGNTFHGAYMIRLG